MPNKHDIDIISQDDAAKKVRRAAFARFAPLHPPHPFRASLVRGRHNMSSSLENLAAMEETVVRDKAVESACVVIGLMQGGQQEVNDRMMNFREVEKVGRSREVWWALVGRERRCLPRHHGRRLVFSATRFAGPCSC